MNTFLMTIGAIWLFTSIFFMLYCIGRDINQFFKKQAKRREKAQYALFKSPWRPIIKPSENLYQRQDNEIAKLKEELKEYYKLADSSAMQIGKLKEDLRIANRNNYYERLCEVIEGNKSLEKVIETLRKDEEWLERMYKGMSASAKELEEENEKLKEHNKSISDTFDKYAEAIRAQMAEITKLREQLKAYDKAVPFKSTPGGNYKPADAFMGAFYRMNPHRSEVIESATKCDPAPEPHTKPNKDPNY